MHAEHYEYVVADGDARRVASAAVRYQLSRPQFWLVVLVALAGVALLDGDGWVEFASVLVGVCVVLAGALLVKRRQLTRVMVARGYRPGMRLSTDFEADRFTVTSSIGSAVHEYADVAYAAVKGDLVLMRMRAARYLVVLPAPLVPPGRIPLPH